MSTCLFRFNILYLHDTTVFNFIVKTTQFLLHTIKPAFQTAKEPTPDTVEAAENQKSEEKISETPKQTSNPFALGSSNFNFGQQNTPPKFKLFGSAQNVCLVCKSFNKPSVYRFQRVKMLLMLTFFFQEQPSFGSFSLGGLSPAIGGFSLKPSSITPASGDVLSPKSSSTKFGSIIIKTFSDNLQNVLPY